MKNKNSIDKKELGIYIHIPFCVKKCDYCDFLSATASEDTKEKYIEALIREITSYKDIAHEYIVKTIFIGGGTPSCIDEKYIVKILDTVNEVFEVYAMVESVAMKKSLFQNIFASKDKLQKDKVQKDKVQKDKVQKDKLQNDKLQNVKMQKDSSSLAVSMEKSQMGEASSNVPNSQNQAEITIEMNPGTITRKKLEAYQAAGINRLSIGLQSTDNEELKILGRIHTYEEFEENYRLAREVGFDNINIDLMSALPGQTLEKWLTTLDKVLALQPNHISAYSLIIEDGTPFYERYHSADNKSQNNNNQESMSLPQLPSEELDREIYERTKQVLRDHGFDRYEISNYAKPGFESRHNSSYWKGIRYLGIGLGASSYMDNARFHNESNLEEYMSLSKDYNLIRRDIERLTQSQQMEEFMFLGLRMSAGISKEDFKRTFLVEIETIFGSVIHKLCNQNLLLQEGDRIHLTDKGIDVSNVLLAQFLLED